MKRLAKILGVVTIPPVIGGILLTLLQLTEGSGFNDGFHYWLSMSFLVFLPLLAYPIHAAFPKLRKGGREAQRKMALVVAPVCYLLGLILALYFGAPYGYLVFSLAYVLSMAFLLFLNGVVKVKASGHACGVTGPVVLAAYYMGSWAWLWLLLLPLVYWARLTANRHTVKELLFGTLSALLGTVIAILMV